ncbi:glycosyltransferase family 2 protein [Bacillus sp. FJAT-53711]|uniref:Glycosyltransferase family 2 protein n=1 Tax=Bacillus yunxiaonensis TaxID=3127665 RepID=A0ABU8FQF0_9BACI
MNFRRLSLCMIVKDEENHISNCLNSIKSVVDEMIIVDTGSSDRTVEICKSFGAQVFDFPWNGSFSAARNYGLDRATGDWILWLDADEEIDSSDVYKLRDALYCDDYLLSIHLINYYGDRPDPNKTFDIAHTRLFQNHKGFKFTNSIHEMLNANEVLTSSDDNQSIKVVPIKVYHYGYLDSVNKSKKKFERNFNMLTDELEQKNRDPWIDYHIASEYYRVEQYDKAFNHVNRSIVGFLQQLKTPPSLLYRLKYSILIGSGSIEGAWPGIERAISLYPDYVDLHFYKGLILYIKESYIEALEVFEHCLEMGEGNLHHLTLKGVGSFQALYYKGCCLEKLGQIEATAQAYALAANLSRTFSLPISALRKLVIKHQDIFGELPKNPTDETIIARGLSINTP